MLKHWLDRLRGSTRGNVVVIDRRDVPDGKCELCQAEDEHRPYGPKGEWTCFDCGMKNKTATEAQMKHIMFGDPLPDNLTATKSR
jgi:hypothetical protein